jgi:hypothetical protein
MRVFSAGSFACRLLLLLAPVSLFAQQVPLVNWTVPPYRGEMAAQGGVTTMTDVTPGVSFVGIQPCRVADTRGNGAPIQGGIFPNSGQRTWDLTGLCGIPAGTSAISANFSVVSPAGTPLGAFLLAWPTGQPAPPTAVMTYGPGATVISNAAVVPLGPGEQLNVNVSHSTHVILDVNGYFTSVYNAGVQFIAAASIGGQAAILGGNFSSAAGSHGVGGFAGGAGVVHGVQGEVGPAALADSSGVHGISNANLPVFGVLGEANGTAGIAVGGIATLAQAGATYGVFGQTSSGDHNAGAVYGFAIQSAANAGIFVNTGAAGAFLGTRVSNVNYGLYTDDRIRGGALDIVGATKNFVAPHPEDPGLEIRYASVEAPTVDVYFRGTASLVNGVARIEVPDHFRFTAREGTYMTTLTPVGNAVVLSVEAEGPDGIVVRGSGGARFHYVVWAERAEIVGYAPVVRNTTFTPEALEKGGGLGKLPESTRSLLVRNGTLHPDGTYNLETARARGWTIPERAEQLARRPHGDPGR